VRSEEVRIARLDDIFAELPTSKAAFLKIDTQGYERQVLWGRRKAYPAFSGCRWNSPSFTFMKARGSSMRV
jgi:hypothetical protein